MLTEVKRRLQCLVRGWGRAGGRDSPCPARVGRRHGRSRSLGMRRDLPRQLAPRRPAARGRAHPPVRHWLPPPPRAACRPMGCGPAPGGGARAEPRAAALLSRLPAGRAGAAGVVRSGMCASRGWAEGAAESRSPPRLRVSFCHTGGQMLPIKEECPRRTGRREPAG